MKYTVIFKKEAEKELLRLPRNYVVKIREVVYQLATNPRPVGCKKLVGSVNEYRVRIGTYRLLYTINDLVMTIYVFKVAHRKEAYR